MIELKAERFWTKKTVETSEHFVANVGEFAHRVNIIDSPWMPLDPARLGTYPEGSLANKGNIQNRNGCDSILTTHTLQPDGRVSVCCGLGIRQVLQLHGGRFEAEITSFSAIAQNAETDLMKLLIRELGPERVLERAARKNPDILWENLYAHRCQACVRLFSDETVLSTIAFNADEFLVDVVNTILINRLVNIDFKENFLSSIDADSSV